MYPQRPAEFEYKRPTSLDEAIGLLAENGDTRPLAGGHSLLPMMKLRLAEPGALVDIGRLPGLDGIELDGDELRIGALATHASVAASELVREKCRVLATTAEGIGDRQVRNRGTIGGSLAHADPGADYPTVVTALGATVVVRGPGGEREIAADDFFTGVFTTALAAGRARDGRARPERAERAAYVKHRHPASGYAVVGVACVVRHGRSADRRRRRDGYAGARDRGGAGDGDRDLAGRRRRRSQRWRRRCRLRCRARSPTRTRRASTASTWRRC